LAKNGSGVGGGALTDRECFEEQDVEFECELNKSKWKKNGQTIICKWFRNIDREIRTTDKYTIEHSGPIQKLTIYNAQFEDEAEYRCFIMEKFVAAKLTVNGKFKRNTTSKERLLSTADRDEYAVLSFLWDCRRQTDVTYLEFVIELGCMGSKNSV
jgi:hypothetical protein